MSASFELTGRIALVTGSSRGIGRAIGRGLAEAGATIVTDGVDEVRLARTRAELERDVGPGRVHAVAFDVTDGGSSDAPRCTGGAPSTISSVRRSGRAPGRPTS